MIAEGQKSHEVFISYSSKDKAVADAACAILERHRIRCWIAPRDIVAGTKWTASIVRALDTCRVMVVIFSGHANASPQVHSEVERAVNKGLSILPFRVEEVRPAEGMEFLLSTSHWLDAFTPPMEQKLEKLAASVKVLLGREGPADDGSSSGTPTDDGTEPKGPECPRGKPWLPPPGRGHGRWVAAAAVLLLLAAGAAVAMMLNRDGRVEKKEPVSSPTQAAGKSVDLPAPAARQDSPPVAPVRATASVASPPVGPTAQVVISLFTDGTKEGWTILNADGSGDETVVIRVKGGPRNHWLEAQGKPNGKFWGWCAPGKFLGNHSDKYKQTLRFAIFTNVVHTINSERGVVIKGRGKAMYVDVGKLGLPPVNRWRNYAVPLDPSGGWKLHVGKGDSIICDEMSIKQILSDVTEIWIKGEYAANSVGSLDNVRFGEAP